MEHKRIAALHDISGFGRGSMTTAIAVCAAAGIQCCPLVGAVLSAHTAYPDVHIRDLTAWLFGYRVPGKLPAEAVFIRPIRGVFLDEVV